MRRLLPIVVTMVLLLGVGAAWLLLRPPAWLAGPFDDGYATSAYRRGDYAKAVKWFRLAADQGHANAQTNLGLMYANGQGVALDYAEALMWFRLAAAQGYAGAQTSLGSMYGNGRGVAQDDAEAVKWYRLAAAQGDALAQSNLGLLYANGRGVAQDDAEAAKWYQLVPRHSDFDRLTVSRLQRG